MLIKIFWPAPIILPRAVDVQSVALSHSGCTPLGSSYFGLRPPFTRDVSFPAWEFILSKG